MKPSMTSEGRFEMDFKKRLGFSVLLMVICGLVATTNAQMATSSGQPTNMNVQTLNIPVPDNCGQECSAYVSINETYVKVDFKLSVEVMSTSSNLIWHNHENQGENAPGMRYPVIKNFTVPDETLASSVRILVETHPELVVASLQIECLSCATLLFLEENHGHGETKHLLVGLDDYGNTRVMDVEPHSVNRDQVHEKLSNSGMHQIGDILACENLSTETKTHFKYVDAGNNYHSGGRTCTYCGLHLISCENWETRVPVQENSLDELRTNEKSEIVSSGVKSTHKG